MYGFCHQRAPGFQDVSGGVPEETLPEGPGFPGSLEASADWEGVGMDGDGHGPAQILETPARPRPARCAAGPNGYLVGSTLISPRKEDKHLLCTRPSSVPTSPIFNPHNNTTIDSHTESLPVEEY